MPAATIGYPKQKPRGLELSDLDVGPFGWRAWSNGVAMSPTEPSDAQQWTARRMAEKFDPKARM